MPSYYVKKAEDRLQWDENRDQIKLKGRHILTRVLNEALAEAASIFEDRLHKGGIAEIEFSDAEIKALLLTAAQRELAPVEGRARELETPGADL